MRGKVGSFLTSSFIRYAFISIVTAVLYFGFLYLLIGIFRFERFWAVSVAYVVATAFHFCSNRAFSFSATAGDARGQLVRYLILISINYFITMAVVAFGDRHWHLTTYASVALSMVATALFGYLSSRYWVFKVGERSE